MSMFVSAGQGREVPPVGPLTAAIAMIGEAPGQEEDRLGEPFRGRAGGVLEACLHSAGITRAEIYLNNVVNRRPKGNDISPFFKKSTDGRRKFFTEAGWEHVLRLRRELTDAKANVLVALGDTALAALTYDNPLGPFTPGGKGRCKITKYRGYVMETLDGRKLIPVIHPASALYKYIHRYIIAGDFKKVLLESRFPEIIRPQRDLVVCTTLPEAIGWLGEINTWPTYACDIECYNYEVSCISFAPHPRLSVAIPLFDDWTLEEEIKLWHRLALVLEDPTPTRIFHNGIFDIHFLAQRCGIYVQGKIEDTMIAHHLVYPELLKRLEFLVSVFCGAQEYYKDMCNFRNIKADS